MNQRDYDVELAKRYVADAESKLREAQGELDHGHKASLAQVEKERAEMHKNFVRLQEAVTRAAASVSENKAFLKLKVAEQERGFEK